MKTLRVATKTFAIVQGGSLKERGDEKGFCGESLESGDNARSYT